MKNKNAARPCIWPDWPPYVTVLPIEFIFGRPAVPVPLPLCVNAKYLKTLFSSLTGDTAR